MRNHKGFTMVELLAVITILSIIMVILIPAVTNISKNTKESILKSKISTIETSASKYGEDNINTYQKCTNALESGTINKDAYDDCIVSVDDLVRYGYLEYDTTKGDASFIGNPVSGGRLDGKVLLCYDPHTITVSATLYDVNADYYSCPAVSESGNYSLNLNATKKDFYWGTHEEYKTKIYTKGTFKSITCEVTGPFTCKVDGDDLIVTLNDKSGSGTDGNYQVRVIGTYYEDSKEKKLYRHMNLGVYVVNYDIDGYTPKMCMKTLTSDLFRITGRNYGEFSLSGISDDLNATIKGDVLYMSSGTSTGEKSFNITENHAGISKVITRQIYDLSVTTHITNVIVGEAAKRINLNAGGTGSLTVSVDSSAASISANNSSFGSTITLNNQNYFYIKGNGIGSVKVTIKGSLCGETSFDVNVSNIKLDNTEVPEYLYFNGGRRQNNDKTQFKSKINGSSSNDFTCTVYKRSTYGGYVENTDYLNCHMENDTVILETTSGEDIYDNVEDFKVNVKSEKDGSLDIYIPVIYKTSLYFKENNETVTKICKDVESGLSNNTITIHGINLGALDASGRVCDSKKNNIVFDSMSDYYLVDLGSNPNQPVINLTNNCASNGGKYGGVTLIRHNVTSEQYNSNLPYKLGRTNTGKAIIFLRENNGNRLAELDYNVYSLKSNVNSITLGVNKESAEITISYAATGKLSYSVSNSWTASVNVVSRSNFSYEPDNINKVFTDRIKIRSYRTGTTYLVIKGADCGELRIPIYVTNVFQINLNGGTYGSLNETTLTCTESVLGFGCSVTLPDFDVPDGITKKGWSTSPSGGNIKSIGSKITINNRNKGTTYYAIADNPVPSCLFTDVPRDIYKTGKAYLNCTDIGGGLDSDSINKGMISTGSGVVVDSVKKVADISNGYRFEIVLKANNYYGPFSLTLSEGAISDTYGLVNKRVISSEIVSAEYEYVDYYKIGKNNREDVIAFLYDNKDIDGSNGYTLSVYGSGEMEDFTSAPWDSYAGRINNIIISNSVTSIGNNAFYGTGITNINIPSSVKSIGTSAFESTNLKMLNVNSETIGKRAFANNLELARVTIGSAVRTIEQYAFSTNSSLSNITFNEGLEYIRDYAFIDTSLGDIVIPRSVQTIGDYAFYNFKGKSADIGNAYVGIAPFRGVNFKEIKASTLEVENNILYNGDTLILVPDKLEGDVLIREGTTRIIYDSLNGLVSADEKKMSLSVPSTVTSIESRINLNINKFIVSADNNNYSSKDGVLFDKDGTTLISVPSYFEKLEYVIDAENISSYALMNNIILKTITLTDSVKSIERNAIYGRGDLGIRTVINNSNVLFSNYYYDTDYDIIVETNDGTQS